VLSKLLPMFATMGWPYALAAGDYVEAEVAQTSDGALPVSKVAYTMSWVAPR
jgi:hypothetical protein